MVPDMKEKILLFLTILIIILATFPSIKYADEEEYIIADEHTYPIKIKLINGTQYVSLQRVADILNTRLIYDEDKNSYTYKFEGKQAILAPGKSLISVDGRLEFISQKTVADGDDILVPVEFLVKIIPLVHKQPMIYYSASKAYVLGDSSDPYNLQINTLSKSDSLRVIIQAKDNIPFKISRDEREVTVKFSKKIILLPFSDKKYTDDIISAISIKTDSDTTEILITLNSEPKDIKSYQYKEPFRLLIDFMRDSADRRTTQPSDTSGEREDYSDTARWLESTDVKTIVIDPGHGGSNEGAIGPSGLKEKEVTLQIAEQLKKIIEQNIAGVKVVLTRTSDIDLNISARTEIANHNKADLFISIHCNGSMNKNARGAEVFILSSEASDDATRIIVDLENKAGESSESYASSKTPYSPLAPILWELAQNEYLRESAALAEEMQAELNQLLDTPERGVKQAPFKILTGAIMPSVLVEVAFITNPKEENELKSDVYQAAVAKAIYRSILRFQSLREQKNSTGYQNNNEN